MNRPLTVNENVHLCPSFTSTCDECANADKIHHSSVWINSTLIDWHMSVNEAFNHRSETTPKSKFSYCLHGIHASLFGTNIRVYLKYYIAGAVHILQCSRNKQLTDCVPENFTEMNKKGKPHSDEIKGIQILKLEHCGQPVTFDS